MINFIIFTDDDKFSKMTTEIIDKIMFKNNETYKISIFNKYDNILLKISNKIYIFDIDSISDSAFTIARKIRENDFDSFITFYTNYSDKWLEKILTGHFLTFTIFNKQKVLDELENTIKYFIKRLNENNYICLKSHNTFQKIYTKDILYIEKEVAQHRICIVTDSQRLSFYKNLADIMELLNDDFAYSHRSCIVNTKRISGIDKNYRTIYFDNGTQINMLAQRSIKHIQNELQNLL